MSARRPHIIRERAYLNSEVRSPCGRYASPMPGCSGVVVMTWIRPAGLSVSFLVTIEKEDAA